MKDGTSVLKVLERQFGRYDINLYDMVGGSGDGGGENEGVGGVHSVLETMTEAYVRRRCLQHVGWTNAKSGLNEFPEHKADLECIHTYFNSATTWNRLKTIAVSPPSQGGVSLFTEGSAMYHSIFRSSPPHILDERPQSYRDFLVWVVPVSISWNYASWLTSHCGRSSGTQQSGLA